MFSAIIAHAVLNPRIRLTASRERAVAVTHDPDRGKWVPEGRVCTPGARGRGVGVRVGHRRGSIFPLGGLPLPSTRRKGGWIAKGEGPGTERGAGASE